MKMEKAARMHREEAAGKEGRTLGPDDAGDDFFKLLQVNAYPSPNPSPSPSPSPTLNPNPNPNPYQDAKDLLPDNSWWVGEEYPAIEPAKTS